MKEWLTNTVKQLVGEENAKLVVVEELEGKEMSVIFVRGPREVLGIVIGKGGRTAGAIRTILNIASRQSGKRYMLNISHNTDTNVKEE